MVPLLELDAGEHPDEPEALWALFDVLCVACGGHAGDEASMARIAAFCAARPRPRLGAHPSYPDREGFGRRSLALSPGELAAQIRTQCAALAGVAAGVGLAVGWVKPHGALYHDAAADPAAARAVIRGAGHALGPDVVIIGPPHGELPGAAAALGHAYLREGFADRATRPDGTLVPRGQPGALILDPDAAAARARALVAEVDVICVHADTPGALAIARAVRAAVAGEARDG
jgi:5-oxoprolinase (ATP-hydrolysing) subunit A